MRCDASRSNLMDDIGSLGDGWSLRASICAERESEGGHFARSFASSCFFSESRARQFDSIWFESFQQFDSIQFTLQIESSSSSAERTTRYVRARDSDTDNEPSTSRKTNDTNARLTLYTTSYTSRASYYCVTKHCVLFVVVTMIAIGKSSLLRNTEDP